MPPHTATFVLAKDTLKVAGSILAGFFFFHISSDSDVRREEERKRKWKEAERENGKKERKRKERKRERERSHSRSLTAVSMTSQENIWLAGRAKAAEEGEEAEEKSSR